MRLQVSRDLHTLLQELGLRDLRGSRMLLIQEGEWVHGMELKVAVLDDAKGCLDRYAGMLGDDSRMSDASELCEWGSRGC